MLERFDLIVTTEEYYDIISRISQGIHLYKINGSNLVVQMEIQGKLVWVLYGRKSDIQEARLKTALIPYVAFVTPDRLSDHYDHKSFTIAVNETIEYFIKLSESLDINDPVKKKEFFMQQGIIPMTALTGAYYYHKHKGDKSSLVGIAVRHIKRLKNIEELEEE